MPTIQESLVCQCASVLTLATAISANHGATATIPTGMASHSRRQSGFKAPSIAPMIPAPRGYVTANR